MACVSTYNAREHLQLAYASTAHGVQGNTADAMQRGTPQLTMQHAVRTAAAEVRSAAKSR